MKKRKVTALLLAFAMVLTAVGCGGGNQAASSDEASTGSDDSAAASDEGGDAEASDTTYDKPEFTLKLGRLTDDERDIIIKGCLINYYRAQMQG